MQYVPKYEDKVQYIVNLVNNIKNINILELGVREGISTNFFLSILADDKSVSSFECLLIMSFTFSKGIISFFFEFQSLFFQLVQLLLK